MGERAERIKYHLWQKERERLLQRPALQSAYHIKELMRLGEAPSLSAVYALEKHDLSWVSPSKEELLVDPHFLDRGIIPPERGTFYVNIQHPKYEPCYRGKPYERMPDGELPDPLDPHRRFPCNEEGTYVEGREWTIG